MNPENSGWLLAGSGNGNSSIVLTACAWRSPVLMGKDDLKLVPNGGRCPAEGRRRFEQIALGNGWLLEGWRLCWRRKLRALARALKGNRRRRY